MNSLHISDALLLLDKGQPVSLEVVKKDGSIMHLDNVVSLHYDARGGTRTIKLLDSRQLRCIRDCLIVRINDFDVYL